MEPQPPLPLESLRRLARGLLYDRERAEDVVQEAWLAALRKKPEAATLPAWLHTAVRHLALNQRRADERRARHEHGAARLDEAPETGEVLAQVEVLHHVLDALATLQEPYRTTVGLRYLEGQPPRAIARKLGLPVNTVRTHVRRGLADLRQRLERRVRREDLLAALAPLAGRMPWSVALGAESFAGLALVAAAAGVIWFVLRTPVPTPTPVTGETTATAATQASVPGPNAVSARREPAGDTDRLGPSWSVHGRVSRGRAGRASHAPVRARLYTGYRSDAPLSSEQLLTTDENGEFLWTLPAPTTNVRLEAECLLADHTSAVVTAVVPRAEAPPELYLRAFPHDATLLGTLRAPDGAPVAHGRLVLGTVRATSASDGRFTLPVASENDALELLAWSTGVGALHSALAPFRPGETRPLEVRLEPEMLVRGTIHDEHGVPLEGVQVRSLFHQLLDEESGLAWSGPDGRYELRLDAGRRFVHLLVSRPGRVPAELATSLQDPAEEIVEFLQQDPEHVDFVLPLGESVHGRVTDRAGAPLEGTSVVVGLHGKTHLAETDGEGRFTLEHVGSLHELTAYHPGFEQGTAQETGEGLLFELERLTPVTGRVRNTRGIPLADVEVFGRSPSWTDGDGAFRVSVATRTRGLTFRAPGMGAVRLELGATREGLEVVLPELGAFRGRVLDAETGTPVTDFELLLFDPDDPGDRPDELPSEWRDGLRYASTDGRWQLAAEFAPGLSMALLVQAAGYAPAFVQDLTSQPADSTEERVVHLYRATTLRGHVSFAEGEHFPLASVQRCTASGGWLPELLHERTLLDEAGNFEFLDTPSGDGYLRVNLRATFLLDGPFLVTGAPVGRAIEVTPQARIEGLLLDPAGRSLPQRMALLVSQDSRGETTHTGAGTDDDGRFRMNGLAPGEHELGLQLWASADSPPSEADLPDDQRGNGPRLPMVTVLDLVERVTLTAGQPLEVVLQARGTTTLRGSLAPVRGGPDIVAVTLTELDTQGRPSGRRRGALAEHGQFEVRALEAGSYDVAAEFQREDGTTFRGATRLEVAPDQAEASVFLELAGP